MAAEPPLRVDSKVTEHPTPPVDAIVIINPKMAIMSLVWENLDEPDSPSSLDSSSPRTYVSETSSSNGLGEMHHTLPSTPVNYGPSTTPVRTPQKAPSREQEEMAVMNLGLENLDVPKSPRSLDSLTPKTCAIETSGSNGPGELMQRTAPTAPNTPVHYGTNATPVLMPPKTPSEEHDKDKPVPKRSK